MSTKKKVVSGDLTYADKILYAAKNPKQKEMLKSIHDNSIVFIKGRPGTGKTFLSVAYALQQLQWGNIKKIIMTRPVIEAAGEKLGFLPGSLYEKIDPYMIPLFSNAAKLIEGELLQKLTKSNGHDAVIEVLPLAYMRGTTFEDCIVIADEMQNSTPKQMRMILTRLGDNCKMIVCGDILQSDIDMKSGLEDAFELFHNVDNIGFVEMTQESIVRHPLVKEIERRYDNPDQYRAN